ncbi:MAG TPA: hypothetical protein VGR21_05350 [Cryptosporangiaceae bacterium]|nr:hypothetical protein [Cryptosporangiaceae bacterium]
MGAMKPVTVTIPVQYLAAARRLAAEDGTTVSGLTARALRDEILRRDMRSLAAAGYSGVDADLAAEYEQASSHHHGGTRGTATGE